MTPIGDRDGLDADGWSDMMRTFERWRMPAPPVPARLRPALRPQSKFCWSTRDGIKGFDMYFWGLEEVQDVLTTEVADYVAVSHAGHGINSYAVNYHVVYQGLAVFAQEAWGGVYMDNDAQTALVADMLEQCRDLIERWEQRQGSEARRLLCLNSALRGVYACAWLPARPSPQDSAERFLRDHRLDSGAALAHAARVLGRESAE